jgi:N-acyl amino acid synthase of PEP-CTERM/exosortase system
MENPKLASLDLDSSLVTLDSLINNFYCHFKLVVANTNKLREEVYKIRYKVYCQELNYESEENCRNGMEQDIYDRSSIHCLLLHRSSGLYAGCVRLVLPAPLKAADCQGGFPQSILFKTEANLPFERVFGHSSQSNSSKLRNLQRYSFGEVSRLAVTSEFRKRNGEGQTTQRLSDEQLELVENERQYFPLISLGLCLAATSMGMEVGLDGAFTIMQPRLARHLRSFGINFCQIGDLVEFRGQRGLFQISLEAVLRSMKASTYELFQVLRSDVRKSLALPTPSLLQYRAAKRANPEPKTYDATLYRQMAVLMGS